MLKQAPEYSAARVLGWATSFAAGEKMLSVFLTVGEKKNGGTFLRPSPYIGDKNVLRHFNALCQVFFGHIYFKCLYRIKKFCVRMEGCDRTKNGVHPKQSIGQGTSQTGERKYHRSVFLCAAIDSKRQGGCASTDPRCLALKPYVVCQSTNASAKQPKVSAIYLPLR